MYFFDPPWGGPDYKNEATIRLKLSDKSLLDIVKAAKKFNSNSFVSFKLPYNYDLTEFSEFNYKVFLAKDLSQKDLNKFEIKSQQPEILNINGLSLFLSETSKLSVKVVNKDVILFKV